MDLEHNENEELEVTPAEPEAAPEAEPETAPVPEAEPEEKPEEKPAEKKPGMSKGAKIAIFLAALALVAAIAACVLLITGRKDHPAGTEAPQTEATEATDGTTETVADKTLEAGEEVTTTYGKAANLIDADNFGKNAVTDNAAYTTGTAEAGDVQMRTVVARDATGYCLTNADLQIYYWMEFYQLMNNYGSYASMLGLDYTKALALQDAPSGGTWEQYFLTSATNNFAEIRALYLAAQEAGYELPETEAKSIEDVLDPEGSFAKSAADNGYDDVDAYLQVNFGKGVTTEIYHDYLLTYYTAVNYYKNVLYGESANALTDAEVEAYYDENAQSYIDQGVTKVNNVSVRHILIQPEGGKDSDGNYSDEAKAAAKAEAERILALWRPTPRRTTSRRLRWSTIRTPAPRTTAACMRTSSPARWSRSSTTGASTRAASPAIVRSSRRPMATTSSISSARPRPAPGSTRRRTTWLPPQPVKRSQS